jgi:hypothetical protein
MNEEYNIELWRYEYTKDAYTDQAGISQWACVVHEKTRVKQIGTEPWTEPYSEKVYPDGHKIFIDEQDRVYKSTPSIDYCGSTSYKCLDTGEFWNLKPINLKGYVYPNGTGLIGEQNEKTY